MSNELSENHIIPGELLFYTTPDGKVKMEIRVEGETIWMSQQMMAELFQTTKQNISLHVANILQCNELQEAGTVKENLTVRLEGSRQEQYRLFCERRREAAEHLAELELQKTLETEVANLRSANKR